MKKLSFSFLASMLVFCMAFTFVSGASYDMSTNENLFNITTISNPSDVYVDGVW